MSSLCDHGSLLSAAVHFKSRERASFLPFTQENAKLPEAIGGAHSEYGLAVEARGISLGRATVRVHGTLEVSFGREVSARSRQERSQVEGAAGKVDGDGSNRPQLLADRAVGR